MSVIQTIRRIQLHGQQQDQPPPPLPPPKKKEKKEKESSRVMTRVGSGMVPGASTI